MLHFSWATHNVVEGFILWPLIHNMLNGWLCHLSYSIQAFPFLSIPDTVSSDIGPAYLSLAILLVFWHCDIPPLFPVFAIPTRSAVSGPRGSMEHSKPLHLRGNFEAPCPPWSICHHVECQEVSLGLTTGHCSPWHSEKEKKKEIERDRGGERGAEGEWTWQRPWNRSVPLSRARGVCSQAVSTSH